MGKNKNRFNVTPIKRGDLFKYNFDKEITVLENYQHPIFCFKYLHPEHNLDKCDKDELSALVSQISKLSKLTWHEIEYTSRKGLGTEKINRSSIKPSIPSFITEDVSFLLSFRFLGKKPFVAYRNKFICHIIYIDNKFDVYPH